MLYSIIYNELGMRKEKENYKMLVTVKLYYFHKNKSETK